MYYCKSNLTLLGETVVFEIRPLMLWCFSVCLFIGVGVVWFVGGWVRIDPVYSG